MIDIEINMNKAKSGWYNIKIYNSNNALATDTNVRLPKKDFYNIVEMLHKNKNINLLMFTKTPIGNYEYKFDYINIDDFLNNNQK